MTLRRLVALAALGLVAAALACDGRRPPLPQVGEGGEGQLAAWRRFAIDRLIDYRVWSGARAGFVVLIWRDGRVVHARTSGLADLETGERMQLDTRFQLASMTKPITAAAAMILVDEGRLDLEAPVSRYLPEFARLRLVTGRGPEGRIETAPLAAPLRVRHLLTFTSGLGGYAETDDPLDRLWRSPDIEAPGLGSLAERIALVPERPLYEPPGTRWRYGWSADVLARVVEVAAGRPFDAFLTERIFEPLGMRHTQFPDAVPDDAPVAHMVTHDADGRLIPEPRFDAWYGRGWTPGGGGLVSTAEDCLRFATMLLQGGELHGRRVLSEQAVEEMTRLQVPGGVLADMGLEGLGWGYGLSVVADASRTPMPAHDGDYWWSGRFGTWLWVSPSEQTIVILMQQTEQSPTSGTPFTAGLVQALAIP
jgi:CubicO group peptidase (beta-lactamase class C family)